MTLPTPESLAELKAALPGAWTQDAAEMAPWLTEWRGRWTGETPLLLQPRTTEEVARAVEICARHGTAIVTQGGGTGLVGGQIPYGEVLLSTRKLRTVRDVTPLDDAMTVEAGVTLLEAQELAKEKGRFFPLSLAAEGSATIGGVISTNAGHRRPALRHDARPGAGHRGGHARWSGVQRPEATAQGQHRL